jgi:hypothetical protein
MISNGAKSQQFKGRHTLLCKLTNKAYNFCLKSDFSFKEWIIIPKAEIKRLGNICKMQLLSTHFDFKN